MMNYSAVNQELFDRAISHLREKGMNVLFEALPTGVNLLEDEILYQFGKEFVNQIEKTIDIDPSLTEKETLQIVVEPHGNSPWPSACRGKNMVDDLCAQGVSMRIYNPEREEMVSFGSYPPDVEVSEETIPLENTITGEVAKAGQPFWVSNIFQEEKYNDKEKAEKLGNYSMMAIPIILPRFSIKDVDKKGTNPNLLLKIPKERRTR